MKLDLPAIRDLERAYGTPVYVFDEGAFAENYRLFYSTMKSAYAGYEIAYSYKTNYTPYICSTVKRLGGYAEVVSGMEYHIAKKLGYEDSRIVFNGPCKGQEGIDAFLNGCIVNADSLDELAALCRAARENPERSLKIGLRINLQIGQSFISRFGMEESDIPRAKELVSSVENLRIAGLHCHISRCRGLDPWQKRTEFMLALADRYFGSELDYLDLGSGMFGSMAPEFAAQFDKVPTYGEYAQVTAALVAQHYKGRKGPVLFTEPGTTLINRFVSVAARVEAIKTLQGKPIAILNCSEHNLGETCMLKQLPMEVVPCGNPQSRYTGMDFTGYTCLEQDVMYTGFHGHIAQGDYVVFGNTGGYSNVYKPPFIRPNCPMVAAKPEGGWALMKRGETFEDLLHTYTF